MDHPKWLRWTLWLIWIILIFILSHQDGVSSSNLSESVKAFIKKILQLLYLANEGTGQGAWGWLIRKIAHMTEYAVLFLQTFRVIVLYKTRAMSLGYSLAFCLLYSLSDEFHQTFIPGRTGTLRDVVIDMMGASMMLVMIKVFYMSIAAQTLTKGERTKFHE